jgi:hypothetical protein
MVLTKDIASNVLQKNLSELILNVTAPDSTYLNSKRESKAQRPTYRSRKPVL